MLWCTILVTNQIGVDDKEKNEVCTKILGQWSTLYPLFESTIKDVEKRLIEEKSFTEKNFKTHLLTIFLNSLNPFMETLADSFSCASPFQPYRLSSELCDLLGAVNLELVDLNEPIPDLSDGNLRLLLNEVTKDIGNWENRLQRFREDIKKIFPRSEVDSELCAAYMFKLVPSVLTLSIKPNDVIDMVILDLIIRPSIQRNSKFTIDEFVTSDLGFLKIAKACKQLQTIQLIESSAFVLDEGS